VSEFPEVKLWEHQRQAVERAREVRDFALFLEPGTGKTGTTINILREKYNATRRVMRTLIFCPPVVIMNWKNEWAKFSKVPPRAVLPLVGSQKQRVALMEKNPEARILIVNYEALLMADLMAAIEEWGPEILVMDESHKLKDSKAKRTKVATKLADLSTVQHRYILSGSPVLNSPMDLFSQFRVLDCGETFSKNFFIFRATYFYDRNAGMPRDRYFPDWQIRPGAIEELNKRVLAKGMSVKKEDCLDLPPLVRQERYVELAPDQRKAYEEMKREFITYLNDKACVATMAITKALRLQQIVSGYIPLSDREGTQVSHAFKSNPRADALRDILEEITPNHKVLIWAVFHENYRHIREVCDGLGLRYVEVHGEIGSKEKFAAVDSFNNDPAVRVFVGHPGSGGIGINLVAASYSIFYSRSFSLEQDLQAEARNHRGGSEIHARITRIDLIAPGTIDEIVSKKLANKEEMGEKLLQDLRVL
jgi:SNF2 family DNA or RNA helicase